MATKRFKNLKSIPREIRGVTELRRNPSKVFEAARRKDTPVLITEFSEPEGVIVSVETYDEILNVIDKLEEKEAVERSLELVDVLDSIAVYKKERAAGRLKELQSLESLSS